MAGWEQFFILNSDVRRLLREMWLHLMTWLLIRVYDVSCWKTFFKSVCPRMALVILWNDGVFLSSSAVFKVRSVRKITLKRSWCLLKNLFLLVAFSLWCEFPHCRLMKCFCWCFSSIFYLFSIFFFISGEIFLVRPLDEISAITHVGDPVLLTVIAEEVKVARDEPPAMATTVQLAFFLPERSNSPPYFENDQ